mmetsp:Transcript_41117/g.122732  ORF Transcript_41117/g.122732 Transcript_41117/m.122732 type:complete len:189 (+) Transcript_41117:139-705(+)
MHRACRVTCRCPSLQTLHTCFPSTPSSHTHRECRLWCHLWKATGALFWPHPSHTTQHPVQVQVLVSHLKSYQRMGAARISCVGGCVCAPLVVQAFDTGGANVSLTSFAALSVTAHPQCQMQVTVLESRGPDGGNKFKVIGVVLHDSPYGAHIPLLGGDHIDYVETKVSGFMPGGFGAGADVRGDLGGD